MTATFVWVTARTFVNRTLARLRRLRDPRYLIGSLAGIAYFASIFLRHGRRTANTAVFAKLSENGAFLGIMAVVALGVLLIAWALPGESGGLSFSAAEIQFLFPAPVSRRQLIFYRVIRSQPQLIFSAAVTAIAGSGRNVVGIWALMTVLSIYFLAVTLGRARLALSGIRFLHRLVVVVAIVGGGVWLLWRHALSLSAAGMPPEAIASSLASGPAGAILFVPRAFVQVAFAPPSAALWLAAAVVVLVGIASFAAAVRLEVAFEDASIDVSQKQIEAKDRRAAAQRGERRVMRVPVPFRLGESGRPEWAVVWKNAIATARLSAGRALLVFISLLAAATSLIATAGGRSLHASGMMTLASALLFAVFGPVSFRSDLRRDIRNLDLLRSLPLSGASLIAGEIAAPLVLVSAIEIVLLIAGTVQLHLGGPLSGSAALLARPEFIVVALLVTIPLTAIQLLIQNAAVVLFPAWMCTPNEETRGLAVTGQRLVVLVCHLAVLGVVLIPAAVILAPSLWIAMHAAADSAAAMAIATVPAVAVLAGEIWLGIRLVGEQFERLDPSVSL